MSYPTITQAKQAAKAKARRTGQEQVILPGDYGAGFDIMSYDWWANSTEGEYIVRVTPSGDVETDHE